MKHLAFLMTVCCALRAAETGPLLPGTSTWQFPADIVSEQYREMREFYERRIAAASRERSATTADPALFRRTIGAIDTFLPLRPTSARIGDAGPYTAALVEWPVSKLGNAGATGGFPNLVREYGILLVPKGTGPYPAVIAIADATCSAADIAGLTDRLPAADQFARGLALRGYVVFAPFFAQRRAFSEPWTNDRSWLFRLAFLVGRHLIGSEVLQVSSAAQFLASLPLVDRTRIGVAGDRQGGLTALYSAALDPNLAAAAVAGYFDRRDSAFDEPEDRTLWRHLLGFGDAEIGAMVAPRPLIVASGGKAQAKEEFERVRNLYAKSGAPDRAEWLPDAGFSEAVWKRLDHVLNPVATPAMAASTLRLDADRIAQIANAQFSQWQALYRNLAMEAYAARDAAWSTAPSSLAEYQRWVEPKRQAYLDVIGRYPDPRGPLQAHSVRIYDEPAFSGYRLSVEVYDGVHAYGILLVPKNIQPGERRPVVFTQHGLGNVPEDALGVTDDPKAEALYARFGLNLVKQGYIVFAPMISTQSNPERTKLVRRAFLVGWTPVGLEIKKFGRVIDYLSTLPFVDANRFAFYGLSYGGYTALWTGPAEPRFQVVIISGNFNEWTLKNTDLTEGTSFLFHEFSLNNFNFGILNTFGHAEIASLMAPRAVMIEIGDQDGVVMLPRRFVDIELEKVVDLYRRLGLGGRGAIAAFHGPHKIDGSQTYPILSRWLNWPAR
jgi:dienelactone hydrolase